MRLLVTGSAGFLGSRATTLLGERGHDVLALTRPGGATRAHSSALEAHRIDAGHPAARSLVEGCDAVLHYAGLPDPARSRADPARAIRENVGTALNLLEACKDHGAGLVYPSTVRAGLEPLPDAYAFSKRLGELACELHEAKACPVRMTSVFGPGQVAWEGATGAIAVFAARALEGAPLVIPGDPRRRRDFLYVDDAIAAFEQVVAQGFWGETHVLASGKSTSLREVAELVRAAAGSTSPIETPGGDLPAGENESYEAPPSSLRFGVRPLAEAIQDYVDWLSASDAAQGRTRA